jgi:hypothetical protein
MAGVSGFRAVWLAVLVAVVGGHDAAAQGYAPPALDTTFFISNETGLRVIEVTPDSVTTATGPKTHTTWIGGMVVSSLTPEERARLSQFFPLTPGKRFAYDYASGSYKSQIELVVQATETLDVGGKAMPVVRVTRHHKGMPPSTFEGEYTIWLSATYGLPLKMSYRHISGEPPKFRDWQVQHIAPPGSLDGVWGLRVLCSNESWIRLNRAVVRDGAVLGITGNSPNTNTITDHDLRLTRVGDAVELKGTAANAGGGANIVSARGTLMAGGSIAGTGVISSSRGQSSNCSFSGERY